MKKTQEETKTKKYFVAEVCRLGFSLYIKFNTDSREDAEQFAALMRRNNTDDEYIVLEQI